MTPPDSSSQDYLLESLTELVADCGHAPAPRTGYGKLNRRLLLGIGAVLCLLIVGAVFHFAPFNPSELGQTSHKTETLQSAPGFDPALPEFTFKTPQVTKAPDGNTALPQSLIASDNMTMVLVKGGTVILPMEDLTDSQRQAEIRPFYMDKTKVTNHLYVQFLHELKDVEVRENSVFWKGRLLLLLGEVADGYEPITYRDNVFRVKPDDAARPVVRVTPAGALAYAGYYGRTLPSMAQWWMAGGSDPEPEAASGTNPVVNSVTHTKANALGIQGLKENVHEWTVVQSADAPSRFYIHGLANKETYFEGRSWEAFANSGFRTVLNVGEKK